MSFRVRELVVEVKSPMLACGTLTMGTIIGCPEPTKPVLAAKKDGTLPLALLKEQLRRQIQA